MQLIANFFAVFFITKIFGRRPLFLFGTFMLIILNFAIAISLYFEKEDIIVTMMCLYMVAYGGSFLPVSWSYPSEIVAAEQTLIPNVIGWIGTSIVTSVPPIIIGAMPDHNAFPLFFFFGGYAIFGFTVIYLKLIESKGLTYEEIISKY